MEQRAVRDQATIDALTLENRRLSDTVAGLEQQMKTQRTGDTPAVAPKPAAVSTPGTAATAPKAAPRQASKATVAGGDWFVNFSSYSQRGVADNWAKKLTPSAGKAVVIPGARDGRTFYRVRIVGLADRAQAEKVAGQLQAAHNLPPLWVGRE
jgi:cell division septation protein DedD